MNDKEHIKGAAKEAEGKVKETIGEATDDSSMKAKGKIDQAEGEARKKAGDVKDSLKD
ncbi:MAG: CsbD family protein [Pseudomonadota bacterium]